MRPPICRICQQEFDPAEGGDLLSFQSHEDEEWPPGKTGHPSHQEWFCADHAGAARELTHLTLPEAMDRLRSQ